MSKTLLKKELMAMSHDEIIEMVIDMYSSRKDAKEYLEFFLNPDIDKLIEKYRTRISKEFMRSKRNYSKARITIVKRAIKEFASFNPGNEYVIEMMLYAIDKGIIATAIFNYTDRLEQSILSLLEETIVFADKNLVFDTLKKRLPALILRNDHVTPRFQRQLAGIINRYGITE